MLKKHVFSCFNFFMFYVKIKREKVSESACEWGEGQRERQTERENPR